MILVLVSGLALAAYDRVGRMTPLDFRRLREGAPVLVPFLIMVALKLGVVIGARARRRGTEPSTKAIPPDEALL